MTNLVVGAIIGADIYVAYQIALGLALLLIGVPIYLKYSPKKEMTELKAVLLSRELMWKKMRDEEKFLAHLLRHLWERAKRIR